MVCLIEQGRALSAGWMCALTREGCVQIGVVVLFTADYLVISTRILFPCRVNLNSVFHIASP